MNHQPIASAPSDDVDPARLSRAVVAANIPTLVAVLYQLTADRRWLTERYRPTRSRGMDDNMTGGLPDEVQDEIRAATVNAVLEWNRGAAPANETLDLHELMEVMEFTMGEPVPHEFGPMMSEVLGFDDTPTPRPRREVPNDFSVVVIGAGIAGMLSSMRLTQAGITHVVLEKNANVGGSWWENTYPGAGVDTPSYLYSLSFFQHPWSTHFGKRDEVQHYLEKFADAYDLRSQIRFGTEVESVIYNKAEQSWTITARDAEGSPITLCANAVISAVGLLNRPRTPALPGIESFTGELFHSARWPSGIDLRGKRVAIVGAGASAMQIGPAIADVVDDLTIFQRSPQWIAPNDVYFSEVGDDVHWLMDHVPYYHEWYRVRLSWIFNDKVHPTLTVDPEWSEPRLSINATNHAHRGFYTRYLEDELEGRPDLVDKCLPDYPPFGKRMLLDNGWYRMLKRPGVQLITEGVAEITQSGLKDADGQEYEFDVIIMATGFHTDRLLYPMDVVGRSGATTREVWGEHDARAYLGVTVPDFPNLFIMTGPNTALGHGGSFITMLECQVRYIMDALGQMIDGDLGVIECRRDVYDDYNRAVDNAHSTMVWTHPGMSNWYRNADGRVVAVLPWRIIDYWTMTRHADLADYVTETALTPTKH